MGKSKAVLVILVGKTDLQVLVDENAKARVIPLDRSAHEAILAGALRYVLSGDYKHLGTRDSEGRGLAKWQGGKLKLLENVIAPTNGHYTLIPAKMDGLIEAINDFELICVVAVGTHFEPPEANDADPIAAAKLVCEFVRTHNPSLKAAGLCLPEAIQLDQTQWINVLHGAEKPAGRDSVEAFNALGTQRIEQMMRRLHELAPKAEVLLAIGGGFPNCKPIAIAAAQFYFGSSKTHTLIEHEGVSARLQLTVAPRASPEIRLAFKRQCLELIKRGQFIAAGFVATEFQNLSPHAPAKPWVVALKMVADLLALRIVTPKQFEAAQAALCDLPISERLQDLLNARSQSSVITAINIESALRDDRIVEAVIANYTLQSQLIFESCQKHFSDAQITWQLDRPNGDLSRYFLSNYPTSSAEQAKLDERAKTGKSASEKINWDIKPREVLNAGQRPWGTLVSPLPTAISTPLRAWVECSGKGSSTAGIGAWNDYRNKLAHGHVEASFVAAAQTEAVKHRIWLDPNKTGGFHLLSHPELIPVFSYLVAGIGFGPLADFYTKLQDQLAALLGAVEQP